MSRRAAAALLALCFLCVAADAQRITAPFNYGWRFFYGPEPGSGPGPNTCTFTKNVTG